MSAVEKLLTSRGPAERALGSRLVTLTVQECSAERAVTKVLDWQASLVSLLKSEDTASPGFAAACEALVVSFTRFATLIDLPRVRKVTLPNSTNLYTTDRPVLVWGCGWRRWSWRWC